MKFAVLYALFTAAIAITSAPLSAAPPAPTPAAPASDAQATLADEDDDVPFGTECENAGGICRKSVCRSGETSVPLTCGHDLGCCLAR